MTSVLVNEAVGTLAEYEMMEAAIQYLDAHRREQPTLKEVAEQVGLSEFYFQRLFTQWVGISPKRFLQFLTKEYARERLVSSESVLEAAYASGLSGAGRLHDLFVTTEAVTPGEVKRRGADLKLSYGFHPSPLGECLLATTGRGICSLMFTQSDGREAVLAELRNRWPEAELVENPGETAGLVEQIFAPLRLGLAPQAPEQPKNPLPVYLKGTNFQIQVWQALLQVPAGCLISYEELAKRAGAPGAVRAVGHAVGQNPVAYLIPCHRVIRKLGDFGQYHYGPARKKMLLARELEF